MALPQDIYNYSKLARDVNTKKGTLEDQTTFSFSHLPITWFLLYGLWWTIPYNCCMERKTANCCWTSFEVARHGFERTCYRQPCSKDKIIIFALESHLLFARAPAFQEIIKSSFITCLNVECGKSIDVLCITGIAPILHNLFMRIERELKNQNTTLRSGHEENVEWNAIFEYTWHFPINVGMEMYWRKFSTLVWFWFKEASDIL